MAKITVTFEDFDDGVHVNVHSDRNVVAEDLFNSEKELTDAEYMCILMTKLLSDKMNEMNAEQSKECGCPHQH